LFPTLCLETTSLKVLCIQYPYLSTVQLAVPAQLKKLVDIQIVTSYLVIVFVQYTTYWDWRALSFKVFITSQLVFLLLTSGFWAFLPTLGQQQMHEAFDFVHMPLYGVDYVKAPGTQASHQYNGMMQQWSLFYAHVHSIYWIPWHALQYIQRVLSLGGINPWTSDKPNMGCFSV
jgi:hypothetical protein